jgi:hypothetical protein
MTLDEAMQCVGIIAGLGTGWDGAAVNTYAEALRQLPDADAACAACELVAMGWTKRERPTFAVIKEAYEAIVRNKRLEQRGLPASEQTWIPPSRGYEIAKEAFIKERRRQGKEPNLAFFEKIFAGVVGK